MPLQPINLIDELNLGGLPSRAPPVIPPINPPAPAAEQREKRPIEGP